MINHLLEYDNVNYLFENMPEFKFMNHGYHPIHKFTEELNCESKHESSLYFHLLDFYKKDPSKSKILDIGCGRGGGIYYLNEKYNFLDSHAVDFCEKSIQFCKTYYQNSGITFSVQDALNLNYSHNVFDIIINVESSHCYRSRSLFFDQCFKLLKNDGYFLYTDTIPNKIIADKIAEYLNKKYKNVIIEDITENVCQSCLSLKDDLLKNKSLTGEAHNYLLEVLEEKHLLYKNKKTLYYTYICFNKKLDYSYF